MKTLYPIQQERANDAVKILRVRMAVYLACQVRTGKTAISLDVARQAGWKKVLFLTKKNIVSGIRADYKEFGFNAHFAIDIVNDESMHKIYTEDGYLKDYDGVIHDEHHRFKAYPKPSSGTKKFKELFGRLPQIWLSGTPNPESYSELYHQFWVTVHSPFGESNFYQWANAGYVYKYTQRLGHGTVNKYDRTNVDMILRAVEPYMVRLTQAELGYVAEIEETFLYVKMKPNTYALCDWLKRDKVIEGKEETILADTAAKLQQKLHQMYSGTVLFEAKYETRIDKEGNEYEHKLPPNWKILDYSKAHFVRDRFHGRKKGIFYKFATELEMLKQVFGDSITTDLDEFNSTDKDIALQIISGREGISLKNAEVLIFINIDFSAISYFQSRDRLTTKERQYNDIYWIFAENGIEDYVYRTVSKKKPFTVNAFKKEFLDKYKITF